MSSYSVRRESLVFVGGDEIELAIELGESVHLSEIVNKITGSKFELHDSPICGLRLRSSKLDVDIIEWRFHIGSGECVGREDDSGYVEGYWNPAVKPDGWGPANSLTEFPIGVPFYSPISYPGYAWYRTAFDLPEDARGEDIELRLGGCDSRDWLEYWVYLNGELIGHSETSGWHDFPSYTIRPSDLPYSSLVFGGSNVLAVQTRGLDRSFPGMHPPDAERYSTGTFLCEQRILIGQPDRWLKDWQFNDCDSSTTPEAAEVVLHLASLSESVECDVTYTAPTGEGAIYKNLTVRNVGDAEICLLEASIEELSGSFESTIGGLGVPCNIDGELFAGVRHPAGFARGGDSRVTLGTFPGKTIAPGECYTSKTVVIGAAANGQAGREFTNHLERHGHRRRELLNMYHCYGIHDVAGMDEPTDLTEQMVLSNLDDLQQLREMGVKFDYYFIDAGWSNPTGDLTDFDPRFFPNGPGEIVRRVCEMDMKLGLWTSASSGPMAFHPEAFKPELAQCGTLPTGPDRARFEIAPDQVMLFEAGVLRETEDAPDRHRGILCMTAEPYRSMFTQAMLHHVRNNSVYGFKFDGNTAVCNNPAHGHMIGLYSMETLADAAIEVLEEVRRECPDVFYMYYWSVRSPWWLLWGNTIYERGVLMEGATPADVPTRHTRQSVTLSLDQGTHHAWENVPLVSGDSLGVWISKWRWGSYLCREEWRDAWIMDIARGSMMCQLWGDLSMFNDGDREFLARMNDWIQERADLLRNPVRILGDPWNAEPYGYAYAENGRGIAFINNPTFATRTVSFDLEGNDIETTLRPFEVKLFELVDGSVIEFVPDPDANRAQAYIETPVDLREVSRRYLDCCDLEAAHFWRRVVNGRAGYADLKEKWGPKESESADQRDLKVIKRELAGTIALPNTQGPTDLILVFQVARDGVFWHHHALYDIILPTVTINGVALDMKSTPHRWHEQAGGWSWVMFEGRVPTGNPQAATVDVSVYLPDGVDVTYSARLCVNDNTEGNPQK